MPLKIMSRPLSTTSTFSASQARPDQRMEEMFQIVDHEPATAREVASGVHRTRRKVSLEEIAPQHRRQALGLTIPPSVIAQAGEVIQ